MQLRPCEVPPERKKLLRRNMTVYNFSDVDFMATWDGTTYRIKAHQMRSDLPAGFCYHWFGDPVLRKGQDQQTAKIWEHVVNKIKHRLFVGGESSPQQLFFNKYLLTGKIGCLQILEEFSAQEKITFPESMSTDAKLEMAARKYYGHSSTHEVQINDGGKLASFEDLKMFGQYYLPDGASVKNIEDGEAIGFTSAVFGSAAPAAQSSGGDMSLMPVNVGTASSQGFNWAQA